MNFFIFATILISAFCDSIPKEQLHDDQMNQKGFILKANNQTCITTVNTTNYKYDLWFDGDDYNYNEEYDPHLICCNEPFSSDTIIPSLGGASKTSLEIIKMDFTVLTQGKTNCSVYYGHWLFGDIPSNAFIPIRGTELTIHPLTVKTLLGR